MSSKAVWVPLPLSALIAAAPVAATCNPLPTAATGPATARWMAFMASLSTLVTSCCGAVTDTVKLALRLARAVLHGLLQLGHPSRLRRGRQVGRGGVIGRLGQSASERVEDEDREHPTTTTGQRSRRRARASGLLPDALPASTSVDNDSMNVIRSNGTMQDQ